MSAAGARRRRPARSRRLLHPPPAAPAQPGRVREYDARARRPGRSRSRRVSSSPPGPQRHGSRACDPGDRGRHPARPLRQRRLTSAHDPLPRDPPGQHGRRLRGGPSGRRVRLRISGAAARDAPLPLHATPLKKHIHKGLYGAFIIDPEPRPPAQELVMVMNGYDTDGDGENNFYTVNGHSSTTPATRSPSAFGARAHLPCERDGVRPHQLLSSPRGSSSATSRPEPAITGSTRTRSCSARVSAVFWRSTSRHREVHVPRAPVGVHGARLEVTFNAFKNVIKSGRRRARHPGNGRRVAATLILRQA